MDPTSRTLLKGFGAGVGGALAAWRGPASLAARSFAHSPSRAPWGVPLHTVRDQIARNPPGTLGACLMSLRGPTAN